MLLNNRGVTNKKENNRRGALFSSINQASTTSTDSSVHAWYWLILSFTVYFYFAAGATKLITSGVQSLDGAPITYEISHRYDGPGKELLMSSFFAKFSAFGAIFAEAGAPLALWNQKATKLFVIVWSVMHLLIHILLEPYYFQNVKCFLWLVATDRPKLTKQTLRWLIPMRLFLLSCVLAQVLYWPITNVYMYSPYFNMERGIYANHPELDYLSSREGLERLLAGFNKYPSVPDLMEFPGNHMVLYHAYFWTTGI
jgi:hypothetical protein